MAESAAVEWDAASDAGGSTVFEGERRWWGRHVHELRWQAELVRLLVAPIFRGDGVVRGDGGPVMLIPGFLAGDVSLLVMADWLGRMGHRAYGSGIRLNVDCSNRALVGLERRLERVAEGAGRPVVLVGHSRGGHFAKALGHRRPELVSRVVSIGAGLDTPFAISQPTLAAVAVARVIHARTTDRRSRHGCFTAGCGCEFSHRYRAASLSGFRSPRSFPRATASFGGRRVWCPTRVASRSRAATSGWRLIARSTGPWRTLWYRTRPRHCLGLCETAAAGRLRVRDALSGASVTTPSPPEGNGGTERAP